MVCYVYDCNYVKVIQMKSRSAPEWVNAYDHIHQELTAKGFKPKLQTLDKEASAALKHFFTANDMEYQLVPPHCHCHDASERAIRTFKDHFVAGLSSVDTTFPLHLWDTFTPGGNHIKSIADLETPSTAIHRGALSWPRGLQQNSFCSARVQNYCTQETGKKTKLGTPRTPWIFFGPSNASLPESKCLHLCYG
jgi:hypothetical protein